MKRYTIQLLKEVVEELMGIINKGSQSSHTFRVSYILLNCDEGEFSEKATNEKISEVEAWQNNRNNKNKRINWQFSTADSRIKLRQLYPSL